MAKDVKKVEETTLLNAQTSANSDTSQSNGISLGTQTMIVLDVTERNQFNDSGEFEKVIELNINAGELEGEQAVKGVLVNLALSSVSKLKKGCDIEGKTIPYRNTGKTINVVFNVTNSFVKGNKITNINDIKTYLGSIITASNMVQYTQGDTIREGKEAEYDFIKVGKISTLPKSLTNKISEQIANYFEIFED